ncbi:hypothetical protein PZ938_00205 [Luteipulveratus sp. YIM 133132]|uniref:hypothetical protein n=1 Tax=Luteipulveratus flavus TaxID=3031728 RepID=UPI0023AE80CD|nr:hypothetical protein [Luteipulveratus sp. YIM 133132]MDE9364016.1 hypothetical protein [Luteipulveratus sp. YIM 133132]
MTTTQQTPTTEHDDADARPAEPAPQAGRRGLRGRKKPKTKAAPTKPATKKNQAPGAYIAPVITTGVKRVRTLDRVGWYDSLPDPIHTSTRQAEALRLTVARRSGTEQALLEGIDVDTGELVHTDPGSDYRMTDGSKSPTRVRIGAIGEGKSTGLKTSGIFRPLLLGRRACVVDKKPMAGPYGPLDVGEYTPVCQALGVEPLRFSTDGTGMRINVLDPAIARVGSDRKGAGQTGLLRATLHEALGRPLTEREGKALRVAHNRAIDEAQEQDAIADIRWLIRPLLHPHTTDSVDHGELREWGLDMAFALERCIEEDLKGLIDGPTDPRVRLSSWLTSFDICTLPDSGPALGITMALIDTWTAAVQREAALRGDWSLLHFLTEESWWLTRDNLGAVTQRNIKMARATGRINEFAFHHLHDIETGSPAMSIIKEAGTVMIYKQDKGEDVDAVARELSIPAQDAERIKTLATGMYALWQPGRPLRFVQHLRSPEEIAITETDGAFHGAGSGAAPAQPAAAGLDGVA